MPSEFREIFLWLRTSGLRLLLIAAASVFLVRLLSSLVDRILHLMANGSGATISEAEKRARTMASLLRTVGTAFIIVIEDQFRVGDVIQAAGVSGQVERMSLRTTIVRDLQGTVHFIPNGEIKAASNLTKNRFDREKIAIPYPHRVVITRAE